MRLFRLVFRIILKSCHNELIFKHYMFVTGDPCKRNANCMEFFNNTLDFLNTIFIDFTNAQT